jgi:rhodanese-related sulfurtransferase
MAITVIETESLVRQHPTADPATALRHFTSRLEFEADGADLYEDLRNGVQGVLAIDARTPEAYARGHVPGAHNLPHRTITPESTAWIPRDAVLVTYCDGIGCNASTKAAIKLSALGFRVKEMVGGFDWWQRDGHPVATGDGHGSITPAAGAIQCGC